MNNNLIIEDFFIESMEHLKCEKEEIERLVKEAREIKSENERSDFYCLTLLKIIDKDFGNKEISVRVFKD